ncbi:transient receptor potential cation channel subfamily M member-like 2 [Symsagittifera roscoffensis]|uniref:transient receptor potential cation channel subfamily M member-like 2 n=1 Tax=Symsagittifera roscoffensis TaxID=84072 RepID=UPI00307C512A
MRFIPDDTVRNVARLLYILDVFFWFMRVLNIFTINRKLGPLVTIILTMIPELLRFFFIWILFMLAFGVIVKSVSEPKRYGEVSFVNMLQIVDMSYWQTYGELFLEDLQDDEKLTNCTKHYDDGSGLQPCPFLPEASLFFTAIYMIIGNILLMNLLIALFTSIYEQVNEKSLTDWKNKRLDVIVEYHTRPPIPPPFSIIYHLFLLLRWKSHMQEVKQSKGLTLDVSTSRMYELLLFEEEVKEEFMMERSSRQGEDVSKQVVQLTQKFDEADKGLRTQIALLENQSRENGKQLAQIQEMLQQLLDKQS